MILDKEKYGKYIDYFNINDEEENVLQIDNASSWIWLKDNIPFFDCPDKEIEEVYYFRWWVFRKHIRKTPAGFIITEFLPDVPWSGKYNSIVCPSGHHLYEGRWIRNKEYINEYIMFWYNMSGALQSYSNWLGNAIWNYCIVTGDYNLGLNLLGDFIADYYEWEKSNLHKSGLFWSIDGCDGGEFSISGNGLRPTLNSYMFGYASSIAQFAQIADKKNIYEEFSQKAAKLKVLIDEKLWDQESMHYKVFPLDSKKVNVEDWSFANIDRNKNVREQLGFIPWYFNIPDEGKSGSWKQLMDKDGFYTPYGPTTAEQRHHRFMYEADHECLWNGPSWPFATSMTLTSMANLLNSQPQEHVDKNDYFECLKIYTNSHKMHKSNGTSIRWLDENLDPYTGEWIARTILKHWGWKTGKGGHERGKDYNHSTYCDLIISGLIGLRPRLDDVLEINPLIPEDWNYFCLEGVSYHGLNISVLFDKDGTQYNQGKGMLLLLNGKVVAARENIGRILVKL